MIDNNPRNLPQDHDPMRKDVLTSGLNSAFVTSLKTSMKIEELNNIDDKTKQQAIKEVEAIGDQASDRKDHILFKGFYDYELEKQQIEEYKQQIKDVLIKHNITL